MIELNLNKFNLKEEYMFSAPAKEATTIQGGIALQQNFGYSSLASDFLLCRGFTLNFWWQMCSALYLLNLF